MLRQAQRLGIDWSMVYVGRRLGHLPVVERSDSTASMYSPTDTCMACPRPTTALRMADGTALTRAGPAPDADAIRGRLAGRDNVDYAFRTVRRSAVLDARVPRCASCPTGEVVDVGAHDPCSALCNRSGVQAPLLLQQGFARDLPEQGFLGGDVDTVTRCSPADPRATRRDDAVCISWRPRSTAQRLDL